MTPTELIESHTVETHVVTPDLPPNCNSWIITCRATGQVIAELWHRNNVEAMAATGRYDVETTLAYLQRINRQNQ